MGDGLPVTENAGISQTCEGVWGERFTLFMTKDVFTDERADSHGPDGERGCGCAIW